MISDVPRIHPGDRQNPRFTNTQWSVILQAADSGSPEGVEALERLCRAYWYPLYAFVRRWGYGVDEGMDTIQDFFSHLLRNRLIGAADRRRGRFRTFLLHALKNFMADQRRKEAAQRRGGGEKVFSLEAGEAESRYALEAAHDLTPEKLFERKWAKAVFARVMDGLEAEYRTAGQTGRFGVFVRYLGEQERGLSHAEAATSLDMTETAFRTAFHRFRQRYRELFRREISLLVTGAREVDEEMMHIIATMGN